jgi:hypothetical protein
MRLLRFIVVVGACMSGLSPIAAGPARFWISTDNPAPTGWDAPTINVPMGRSRKLYVWVQPATETNGALRTLTNFSLDVVTQTADSIPLPESQPFVDFVDDVNDPTITAYNDPVVDDMPRFQFTFDAHTSPDLGGPLTSEFAPENGMLSAPDAVRGVQGLSIATTNVVGIGHAADPYRVMTSNGPAWRVAEFSVEALQPTGTNHLFLQIGWAGMSHSGSDPTQVVFGNNASPVYSAGPGVDHRQITLPGDTYDIRINAVPFSPGDYNSNGSIGQEDFHYWKTTFGNIVSTPGDGADGNQDGAVDAADYIVWRKLLGGGAGAGSDGNNNDRQIVIPEPATSVMTSVLVLLTLFRSRRGGRS